MVPTVVMTPVAEVMDALAEHLCRYLYNWQSEVDLQKGVALVLSALVEGGYEIEREKALTKTERPDFYVKCKDGLPRIAVELKVKGSQGSVYRQIDRYASLDDVDGVLLVTPCHRLVSGLPEAIEGKPVRSVLVRGRLL